jgi:hypothetical protein
MTNSQIYRKTFVFSWIRFLLDFLSFILMIGCIVAGYYIANDKGVGVAIGALVGLVLLLVLVSFITYIYKSAQIAMMTKAITEGSLPNDLVKTGINAVKGKFKTIFAYYAVTSVIKGIFAEITAGINTLSNSAGEVAGNIGSAISAIINIVVAYLCDCCLGWVFYRNDNSSFKSTCEGATLFFKNWQALLKNLGRIFLFGIISFIIIGGTFSLGYYFLIKGIPNIDTYLAQMTINMNIGGTTITDPQVALMVCCGMFGIVTWIILHNAFVKPFVLVGVLRNYINAGIASVPNETDLQEMGNKFKKFNKALQKA